MKKLLKLNLSRMSQSKYQGGQVAIVILLIMVVLLTVGLSLASRTTQGLFLSKQESESARVFNAAEVGVEDALSQDFSAITGKIQLNPSTVNQVNINTTIQPNSTLETKIVEGAAINIDLGGYGDSSFDVDWAKEDDCTAASLLVSIYYKDGTTTKVVHEALGSSDSAGSDCVDSDDFVAVTGSDAPYSQSTIVNLPGGSAVPLFARIRAIYNDTAIRVSGGAGFPTQFFVIRSEADTQVGKESRTVEVGRTLSSAPSFMDYALYSGSDISIEAVP